MQALVTSVVFFLPKVVFLIAFYFYTAGRKRAFEFTVSNMTSGQIEDFTDKVHEAKVGSIVIFYHR